MRGCATGEQAAVLKRTPREVTLEQQGKDLRDVQPQGCSLTGGAFPPDILPQSSHICVLIRGRHKRQGHDLW